MENLPVDLPELIDDEIIYTQAELPYDVYDRYREKYTYDETKSSKKIAAILAGSAAITTFESIVAATALNRIDKANTVLKRLGIIGVLSSNSSSKGASSQLNSYIAVALVQAFYMWIISVLTIYANRPDYIKNSKIYTLLKKFFN